MVSMWASTCTQSTAGLLSNSQSCCAGNYTHTHAWLNLWDKHLTTGSINQVYLFQLLQVTPCCDHLAMHVIFLGSTRELYRYLLTFLKFINATQKFHKRIELLPLEFGLLSMSKIAHKAHTWVTPEQCQQFTVPNVYWSRYSINIVYLTCTSWFSHFQIYAVALNITTVSHGTGSNICHIGHCCPDCTQLKKAHCSEQIRNRSNCDCAEYQWWFSFMHRTVPVTVITHLKQNEMFVAMFNSVTNHAVKTINSHPGP